jgi:hypothetical protein
MASNSKKTDTKRLNKQRTSGQDRKRRLEREGTTRSEKQLFGNVLPKTD